MIPNVLATALLLGVATLATMVGLPLTALWLVDLGPVTVTDLAGPALLLLAAGCAYRVYEAGVDR
ncbi:hypothetical protein MF406_14380 [Georgenia sp. TF02-10]|uniref:hypothetical protein n=1 Tax=Georgenia sp. TF02-10 TaxID=2917725 RepID=UPI001FA7E2F6|nr:hypothetical protein [Georgenia sp. TF02-10]UNX54119.1 hypothetical protein MF406_14380 [Georgenia sp. TF02-10]